MTADDDYSGIDIDAPTVEVIRANDTEIQRLGVELGGRATVDCAVSCPVAVLRAARAAAIPNDRD